MAMGETRGVTHPIKPIAIALLFVFALSWAGCGGKRLSSGESPEVLYDKVTRELSKKGGFPYIFRGTDYDKALDQLKEIQLRHTYSPYATLAELRIGDVYFKKEEYEQSAIEYEEFIKRHPGHKEAPYATYRLALSHYNLRRTVDRDPTNLREAKKWFEYFMQKYPDSEYYSEVERLYAKTRNLLAEREMYIASFYRRKKNYRACSQRYNDIVRDYPDTKFHEEALYRLGESYWKMGEYSLAVEPLQRVVREYPGASYSKRAKELLAKVERSLQKAQK
jgi:outer membrane protein assembly factor BamD